MRGGYRGSDTMIVVSLTEARVRLSELISRAGNGETIQITRRGKPVAQITAMRRKPIDIALLRSVVERCPMQTESAGDFIRRMRDDSRY